MARYYFNIKDGQTTLDTDGVELADMDAVRKQAVIATGTMLHDHGAEFWKDRDWQMWVTDEAGSTVCALRISGE